MPEAARRFAAMVPTVLIAFMTPIDVIRQPTRKMPLKPRKSDSCRSISCMQAQPLRHRACRACAVVVLEG